MRDKERSLDDADQQHQHSRHSRVTPERAGHLQFAPSQPTWSVNVPASA